MDDPVINKKKKSLFISKKNLNFRKKKKIGGLKKSLINKNNSTTRFNFVSKVKKPGSSFLFKNQTISLNRKMIRIFDVIVEKRNKILKRLSKINFYTFFSLSKKYLSLKWLKDLRLQKGLFRYKKELESLESQGLKRKIQKRRLKLYALALYDKQKIKYFYYGLKEYILKNIVKIVFSSQTNPLNVFIQLLESQLFSFLYRTNIFKSVIQLKIFLKLGYVLVNGNSVTSKFYFLKEGDSITFSYVPHNTILQNLNFRKKMSLFYYPSRYMEISFSLMNFLYYRRPSIADVAYPFNINLSRILYFYSYKGLR
jgi:ribosomal protein S4